MGSGLGFEDPSIRLEGDVAGNTDLAGDRGVAGANLDQNGAVGRQTLQGIGLSR